MAAKEAAVQQQGMSPEERADQAVDWLSIPDADGDYDDDKRQTNVTIIAEAIREAEQAMKRRCADAALDFLTGDPQLSVFQKRVANAILGVT